MRSKANMIIALHLLKSGNIRLNDLVFFIRKGLKLVDENIKAFKKKGKLKFIFLTSI